MKTFRFTWYKNEKYAKPLERKNLIKSDEPQEATSAFMSVFGNLKKNTIVMIEEIDAEGRRVGEPIIPEEGTSPLVPSIKLT